MCVVVCFASAVCVCVSVVCVLCVSVVCVSVCVCCVCWSKICVLPRTPRPSAGPPLRRTPPPPDRPSAGPPKISLFFFLLPPPFSFFFSLSLGIFSCLFFSLRVSSRVFFPLSGGLLVKFWWCLKRRSPSMCGVWSSQVRFAPPPPPRTFGPMFFFVPFVIFCPKSIFLFCPPRVCLFCPVSVFLVPVRFFLSRGRACTLWGQQFGAPQFGAPPFGASEVGMLTEGNTQTTSNQPNSTAASHNWQRTAAASTTSRTSLWQTQEASTPSSMQPL